MRRAITSTILTALLLLAALAALLVPAGAVAMPEITVQGVVWNDADCDGIRQTTEMGLPVHVHLFAAGADNVINTSDDQVIQVSGGPTGMYIFDLGTTDLDYALLILPIARPAGFIPGPLNAGSDRSVDNDMRTDLWATNGFRMDASQTVTGIDIGLCRNANTTYIPLVMR